MSNKFDCLITGGTRNGSAAEFTFQFVNDTEENRFLDLHGTALGYHELACTVIVKESVPAELLRAAKELVSSWENQWPNYRHYAVECLRAAIAKAEGEGV